MNPRIRRVPVSLSSPAAIVAVDLLEHALGRRQPLPGVLLGLLLVGALAAPRVRHGAIALMTAVRDAFHPAKQIDPSARIIALTMYRGDEDIYRAFEAGAMGYVLKDTISDDLIHVIREAHAGRRVVTPDIQQALDERARHPALSLRERQVLELVAEGMRNKEISAALGISADTTGMHVKNIYTKLHVHDRTAAVAKGIRRGIIRIE